MKLRSSLSKAHPVLVYGLITIGLLKIISEMINNLLMPFFYSGTYNFIQGTPSPALTLLSLITTSLVSGGGLIALAFLVDYIKQILEMLQQNQSNK